MLIHANTDKHMDERKSNFMGQYKKQLLIGEIRKKNCIEPEKIMRNL